MPINPDAKPAERLKKPITMSVFSYLGGLPQDPLGSFDNLARWIAYYKHDISTLAKGKDASDVIFRHALTETIEKLTRTGAKKFKKSETEILVEVNKYLWFLSQGDVK